MTRHGGQPLPLLGPAEIRDLAEAAHLRPTKHRGQNFMIDANTVRRIVRLGRVQPCDDVLEIGPGLGSLTLALVDAARSVVAIEVDPALARLLPRTVARLRPARQQRLRVIMADALSGVDVTAPDTHLAAPGDLADHTRWPEPTKLIANLPYNIAVPAVLTALQRYPSISSALVLVQAEVAERIAAAPGSKTYGAPSVKVAWFARAEWAGSVGASVFWPAPRVESGLVRLRRRPHPPCDAGRERVFAVIDAAFAQRRKTLRAALSGWAGSPACAERLLTEAGIDPGLRGERLGVEDFCRLADAAHASR